MMRMLQCDSFPEPQAPGNRTGGDYAKISLDINHYRAKREANLEALDPVLTQAVAASFVTDFAQSQAVSLQAWQSRPLWRRVKQRVWGWVDRLVVNLVGRR